jgi:sigma-B regulation protein RsbU (phosphoserine phosphatase)
VYPGRSYRSLSLQLEAADLLMIYTDGVTEAENLEGQPFGMQGCQRLLHEAGGGSLDTLIHRLRQRLRGFTSSDHLEDDCTLLLLRRLPEPSVRAGR